MKTFAKVILAVSLSTAYVGTAMAAQTAEIKWTGSVVANTCLVNEPSKTVDFGLVQPSSLAEAGSASEWKSFELGLNSCPEALTTVHATFAGTADADATLYANTGDAANVAIELQDSTGANAGNGAVLDKAIAEGNAVYALQARVKSTNGGATAGSINGVVNVNFTYE
jgi:minor fimbrial subunit